MHEKQKFDRYSNGFEFFKHSWTRNLVRKNTNCEIIRKFFLPLINLNMIVYSRNVKKKLFFLLEMHKL